MGAELLIRPLPNVAVAILCLAACVWAGGNLPSCAADFPAPFNTESASEDTLMPASEAAAKMSVPDGFRVSAFAAEPDVQNPIACDWDAKGRLWVAENYTYAEREQKFQMDLRDRVLIFDGTDRDRFSKRTVFTDNASMLTGIAVGRHGKRRGVWLMCPPRLLFVPDDDQDDIPDNDGEVILDGFKVADTSYHTFANGIRFGPDGWLYGRCGSSSPGRIGTPGTPDERRLTLAGGMWRYHPDRQVVETLVAGTTNPWGHDFNAVGDGFFINTVNGHFWNLIHGAHYTRPFTLDPNRQTFQLIDTHADHWHFDTGGAWHESRDGVANEYGGGHAHCGLMIYQGGRWPQKYHGKLFTLNLHGRRVNQEILKRDGSGYVASHGRDLFVSADPWFRGMEITSGPDGNAFILDWSDTGECHEHSGVHRTSGRIFKVIGPSDKQGTSPAPTTACETSSATPQQLVQSLQHPNAWFRRQASIELARRAAGGADLNRSLASLVRIADQSQHHEQVVQAILMAHAAGRSIQRFDHPNEYVRSASIRVMTDHLPLDDAMGDQWKPPFEWTDADAALLVELNRLAETDTSLLVQKTLASTLQRLPVGDRVGLASRLCRRTAAEGDHNIPLLVWYGLIPVSRQHPQRLVDVAATCELSVTLRLMARSLAEQIRKDPQSVNDLLRVSLSKNDPRHQIAVLNGMAQGLRGQRTAPRPNAWDRVVDLDDPDLQSIVRELSVVFGDGRAIQELVDIALGKTAADYDSRTAALRSLIQADAPSVKTICQSLLKDAKINVTAARGLAKHDDPAIGNLLTARYRNFRGPDRPQLVSVLVSRKSFAMPLLSAIDNGTIPRDALTPFHVRQMLGLNDPELTQTINKVWGTINDTPEAIEERIADLKRLLTDDYLDAADKSAGRVQFVKHCQSCHKLYGQGEAIGPDLTGTGRSNLDYLLENIVNPSGVVDKDYSMTLLLTDDGRVLSGLVTSENEHVVTIETLTDLQTIEKDSLVDRKQTDRSPMPDGLLDAMSDVQVRDLIGYLRHPHQVALPTTPASLP